MRLKKLLRKPFVYARRIRSREKGFRAELAAVVELNSYFGKMNWRWIKLSDAKAQRTASETLAKIHKRLRRLARNNHQRELRAFLQEHRIVGFSTRQLDRVVRFRSR